eukprot:14569323-Ditylum_brightwellii.AAC.1
MGCCAYSNAAFRVEFDNVIQRHCGPGTDIKAERQAIKKDVNRQEDMIEQLALSFSGTKDSVACPVVDWVL